MKLTGCGDTNTKETAKSFTNTIVQKLLAPDAEGNDYFGRSAAIDGDYAIVGAVGEDSGGNGAGAAYIFYRTGDGSWDAGTKIVAPDPEPGDNFGISVSISGDYAIAGADHEDSGAANAGAAYIFHRTGSASWDTGTKIVAPDPDRENYFGRSVSISGDYAIVGAFGDTSKGQFSGAAYIFHRTGVTTWDAGIKIVSPDLDFEDNFGISVAMSNDYALVGAFGENSGGGTDAGAAYIFHRTGVNTWDAGTKIVAPDPERDDYFGISVGISGDYAIVGAWGENTGALDSGAAYVYHRTGENSWDSVAKIKASDLARGDRFGGKVAIYGSYAIIASPARDSAVIDTGAAYIFRRSGENSWDSVTKITAPEQAPYFHFGISVGISGDSAIAGAFGGFNTGHTGAAYIY
jgi:hypothetical protein